MLLAMRVVAILAVILLSPASARELQQDSPEVASEPQGEKQPPQQQQAAPVDATGNSVEDMSRSVFNFWLQHGQDTEYGGFHATLSRQGSPIPRLARPLCSSWCSVGMPVCCFLMPPTCQARHLWAMSALLRSGQQSQLSSAARRAADSLFRFLKDHMLTTVQLGSAGTNGQAFVYEVNREGTAVLNPAINVYGNAFAIYGLANYAQATASSEARDLAVSTFNSLEALYHNTATGGYDETSTIGGLIFDSVPLPDGTKSQSFNTLLHVTEALTELSRATGGSNTRVQSRLLEHVKLLTGPAVVQRNGITYIATNYDPRTWTPVGGDQVSYGHNLEAAWLLADAVDVLVASGTLDSTAAGAMKSTLRNIGQSAVQHGYDATYSGFYEGGSVTQGTGSIPSNTNKVWWVQAEALLGLGWLYRQTSQQQYRDQLQGVLGFIRQYIWDKQYGEWYWQVPRAGGVPLGFTTGGVQFAGDVKGNWWKASYHTGRALLLLQSQGY